VFGAVLRGDLPGFGEQAGGTVGGVSCARSDSVTGVSVVDGANVGAFVPRPAGRGWRVGADRPDAVADAAGRVAGRAMIRAASCAGVGTCTGGFAGTGAGSAGTSRVGVPGVDAAAVPVAGAAVSVVDG
jgi:hypothetical protein